MKEILLNAHAKINLSLEITGRRENGYHDIDSVMQGVSLYDLIKVSDSSDGRFIVSCRGVDMYLRSEAEGMPYDESNLAIKGLKAVINAIEDELPAEVTVEIDKRLPVAAGIAGGSGNAAAAMLGLNAITGSRLSLDELMRIGTAVGADVPFSLAMNAYRNRDRLCELDGLAAATDSARARGIGEVLEGVLPVRRFVILANPGISVSTKEVYEAIDSEDRVPVYDLFFNRMEEYTLEQYPEARLLKEMMSTIGADEVLMSGSGPTIVAYFRNESERDKGFERLCAEMKSGWRAWKCSTGEGQ